MKHRSTKLLSLALAFTLAATPISGLKAYATEPGASETEADAAPDTEDDAQAEDSASNAKAAAPDAQATIPETEDAVPAEDSTSGAQAAAPDAEATIPETEDDAQAEDAAQGLYASEPSNVQPEKPTLPEGFSDPLEETDGLTLASGTASTQINGCGKVIQVATQ